MATAQHLSRVAALLLAAVMTSLSCLAYNITGYVVDPEGEMLPQASIRLIKAAKDSTYIGGVTTNLDGFFSLTNVKNGKYVVEISYIGYEPAKRDVIVKGSNVKLDSIRLSEGGIALREVMVTGVRTPVKVMEDTVEYDAGAYKTQPNAVVEDLLKRLPGVEVADDGSITANGKTVSKILLDGEEFFSDDPKVASKNLPVEMIQKLQVVDRKSDLARMTGVDDGEDETVINLTVKPGMKNGWFGTMEGGYGTDDRYKGTFNVNRLWGDNQSITLLGNFNNVNEEGFTDSNGSRFRRWGGNSGINTTQSFGLNFNVGNKQIFRAGGSVIYSHSDRNTLTSSERTNKLNDVTKYESSASDKTNKSNNVRGDFRIQWKPDSFNTLEVRPNFSLNYSDTWSTDSTLRRDINNANVNRNFSTDSSNGHSFSGGVRLIYNHNFRRRKGRSFSVMANYSHTNTEEDENAYNEIFYWKRLPSLLNDSTDIYDQIFDNHTWNDNVVARLSWTEPLGDVKNGNFLTLSYRMQYRWNNADKLVYDHPVIWPDGTIGRPSIDYSQLILNDTLSNRFRNDYFNQEISFGFRKVTSVYNLNVGVNVVPQMSRSRDLIIAERNIPARWVWNFAPFLRYRHRFTKTMNLQADYRGRSSQPSLTQLQPVPDTSDPLRIVVGNPNLDPSYTHNLNIRFNDFNGMAQRSFMTMLNISMTQNSIVSRTYTNELGGQTLTYENVSGVWSGRFMGMFSQPLRNKYWSVSANAFINLNRSVGFINNERNASLSTMINFMPGIAFRPDNLEFELRPRYSYQTSSNSVSSGRNNSNPDLHSYGGSFRAYWYMPFGLTLSSDLSYTATSGYGAGYDKNEWIWNASISYQTLRDKSLTFSIKGYDLLHQRKSVSYQSLAEYDLTSRVNSLTRYFMATVAWRFNTVGKGARTQGMGDGPGGFGPPHGGGRHGGGGPGRHF